MFRTNLAIPRHRLRAPCTCREIDSLHTLRSLATQNLDQGDSLTAEFIDGGADGLEGFRAWREDRSQEAAELLENARLKTVVEYGPMKHRCALVGGKAGPR